MLYSVLRDTFFFNTNPETAHHYIYELLKIYGIIARPLGLNTPPVRSSKLLQQLMGETFLNPIGLAAGFDKNACLGNSLASFGFGFCEVGSITAEPCMGNNKPRLFRIPQDRGLMNRMGLNNEGIETILPRLMDWPHKFPLGINITKTPGKYGQDALNDFMVSYKKVLTLGTYHVLNISCPNTSDGKTYESPEGLEALLLQIDLIKKQHATENIRPLFIKVSADISLNQLDEMLEIALKYGVAGWVTTNTTKQTSFIKNTDTQKILDIGQAGISGEPLYDLSTGLLGYIFNATSHWQTPPILIGVGGVHDTETAWQKICLGASLIQLYTGWIYEGPKLARKIEAGLIQKLDEAGLSHISQAKGMLSASRQKISSS